MIRRCCKNLFGYCRPYKGRKKKIQEIKYRGYYGEDVVYNLDADTCPNNPRECKYYVKFTELVVPKGGVKK